MNTASRGLVSTSNALSFTRCGKEDADDIGTTKYLHPAVQPRHVQTVLAHGEALVAKVEDLHLEASNRLLDVMQCGHHVRYAPLDAYKTVRIKLRKCSRYTKLSALPVDTHPER